MATTLPTRPSLEWLRKRAKERLAELRRREPSARLAEAQLAVAREHGCRSWRHLKAVVEAARAPSAGEAPAEDDVAAFLRAAGLGEVERVRAMLAAAPGLVDAVGPHPFWGGRPQALHVAVEGGRREVFDLLLDAGADVEGRNDAYAGWSPLLLAIQRERREMRDELLRRGARVGLAEALMMGDDARVAELLAARPAAVEAPAPSGGGWLAFARTPFAVDRLLALGVPVDRADAFGVTPVQALAKLGERGRELVRRLVAAGAEASAADVARLDDRPRLEALADADPAAVRDPAVLVAAVEAGNRDLVAWLLDRGADPSARAAGEARQTVLHVAAWAGDLAMARLLVARGADVAARDDEHHETPAGWAETAVDVANRPRCREVAAFLRAVETGKTPASPARSDG